MPSYQIEAKDPANPERTTIIRVDHDVDFAGFAHVSWAGAKLTSRYVKAIEATPLLSCENANCEWRTQSRDDHGYECCPRCAQTGKVRKLIDGALYGYAISFPAVVLKTPATNSVIRQMISVLEDQMVSEP